VHCDAVTVDLFSVPLLGLRTSELGQVFADVPCVLCVGPPTTENKSSPIQRIEGIRGLISRNSGPSLKVQAWVQGGCCEFDILSPITFSHGIRHILRHRLRGANCLYLEVK